MALRILLCDDNRDFVSTLALLLQSEGHETWQCLLGRAAIDKARQWQPDLALIDIGLPDVTGYAVAQEIRRMPFGKALMLVAVTGYSEPEDVRHAASAGFDLHMKKGTDAMVFVELAARLAAKHS
jgi:two-component system CheB/CheR fusion protein